MTSSVESQLSRRFLDVALPVTAAFSADWLLTVPRADLPGFELVDFLLEYPSGYAAPHEDLSLDTAKRAARLVTAAEERHQRSGNEKDKPSRELSLDAAVLLSGYYVRSELSGGSFEVGVIESLAGDLQVFDVHPSWHLGPVCVAGLLKAYRKGGGWEYNLFRPVVLAEQPEVVPRWDQVPLAAGLLRSFAILVMMNALNGSHVDGRWLGPAVAMNLIYSPSGPDEVEFAEDRSLLEDTTCQLLALSGREPQSGAPQRVLPPPRLIKGYADAEQYAVEVMHAFGFADSRRTSGGSDGGVDVEGSAVVAQVKMEALPTGRDRLQALYGIATLENKVAFFFSLAGYSEPAVQWADRAGLALFEFAFDGSITASNELARSFL